MRSLVVLLVFLAFPGPGRAAEVENEKMFEIFGVFFRSAFSERFWCVFGHIWGSFAVPFRIIFGIDFRRKKDRTKWRLNGKKYARMGAAAVARAPES